MAFVSNTLIGIESGASLLEWSSTSGASVETTIKRTGARSLKIPSSTTDGAANAVRSIANTKPLYVRIYFLFDAAPTGGSMRIFRMIGSDNNKWWVRLKTDRTLELMNNPETSVLASGSAVLNTNTWYRLGFEYTGPGGSAGVFKVYVDGTLDVNYTGHNETASIVAFRCQAEGPSMTNSVNCYFDDIVGYDDALPGPGQIELAMRPAGDSVDSGEDSYAGEDAGEVTWDNVDDDPIADSTYATASGTNKRQLWTLTTPPSIGTLKDVVVGARMYRGNGGGTTHHIRAKVSTAENSADLGLGTSVGYFTWRPTTQPTAAQLATFQPGAEVNGARAIFVTELYVLIHHTPTAAAFKGSRGYIQGG